MKLLSLFPDPRSPFPSRRGSALLIVLGMVSFMVISSVAFSIYMRTSRMPSNYLRRSTSSRMLLRSTLANAIERIDGVLPVPFGNAIEGVYDDYYPGLSSGGNGGNRFVNRVFAPFKDVAPIENPNTPLQDSPIPVATLTFEGLAYLPPAIINEVRYQSHRTSTACWRNLPYEYGRYAFVAVDVSDCLDVNKLCANSARTSAARQRIGLSTLFAEDGLTGFSDMMGKFDNAMNEFRSDGRWIPFVSMADYNLYFGAKLSELAPFCKYVGSSGSGGNLAILQNDSVAASALFITDTWFPATNSTDCTRAPKAGNLYDLSVSDGQPFDEFREEDGLMDIVSEMIGGSGFSQNLIKRLGGMGVACLYDYLDKDSVPLSLALPTVETAPMVCAMGLDLNDDTLKPRVAAGETRNAKYDSGFKDKEGNALYNEIKATRYDLQLLGLSAPVMAGGLAALPFKRLRGKDYAIDKFKYKGYLRVCLAPADLQSQVSDKSPLLAGDWGKTGFDGGFLSRSFDFTDTVPQWKDDMLTEADAVQPLAQPIENLGDDDPPRPMYWRIEHKVYTANAQANPETKVWYSLDGIKKENPWIPFEKDGLSTWWDTAIKAAKEDMFTEKDFKPTDLPTTACGADDESKDLSALVYTPTVLVWIKVEDGDGKVVDLVPACGTDDATWNKRSECDIANTCQQSDNPPLIRFRGGDDLVFNYGQSAAKKTEQMSGNFKWQVLYTVDPRFNYAPEAWYAVGKAPKDCLQNGNDWIDSLKDVLGSNGRYHVRDSDIFMFTGDQEYLQAMGELQFLPALRDLRTFAADPFEVPVVTSDGSRDEWNPGYQFDSSATAIAKRFPGTWETYSAPDGDPIYTVWTSGQKEGGAPIEVVSASGDFRINPFTPDERIFRAAIANTPYDWYVASTNKDLNLLGECGYQPAQPTADDAEALQFTFSSKSQCASAKWPDGREDANSVYDIASALSKRLRDEALSWDGKIASRRSWERVYDDVWRNALETDGDGQLFGISLPNALHGVDRKFLHGFWRECFQNRQQLFLVFLRAEPLTVGGSGTASMANAQTGARGVALVWRDPEPPTYRREERPARSETTTLEDWKCVEDNVPPPHRTRILFYHQFD